MYEENPIQDTRVAQLSDFSFQCESFQNKTYYFVTNESGHGNLKFKKKSNTCILKIHNFLWLVIILFEENK